MPLVNIGAAATRSQVAGITTSPVNSIGVGTDSTAEALTFTQLGSGANPLDETFWRNTSTGATLSDSTSTDTSATTSPWWQLEFTLATSEFNGETVYEIGTGWGSLNGQNPATENNKLYSRKRVGGSVGLGKTSDYSLIARVRMTYPSS